MSKVSPEAVEFNKIMDKEMLAARFPEPALQEFLPGIDFKHFLSFTWTLRFKRGQTLHTKNFYFEGTMTDAKCRAYAHCGAMDYAFINISRFIVDLDHQENYKRTQGSYIEEGA